MNEINTQVTTYDPEAYVPYHGDGAFAVMEVVEDGTGDWVNIVEHEELVRKLKERIIILENCNHELLGQLTGDW